jgi:acyl-CoA reductase-like NAD-dependent aldehyde dehydrogenase
VSAARAAFDTTDWVHRPRERSRLLRRLAGLIDANAERLARIESADNGKTLREECGMYSAVGGYGQSGYGRFGGVDGYREMTRVKSVQILLASS